MNLPVIQDPLLVTVDMQERLVPAMAGSEEVVARVKILLQGAAELKIPVIATEQYPKGLGPTLPEISELFPEGTPVPAKTSFSVFGEPEFRRALGGRRPHSLIFCGIEAHVCVLQSLFDAIEEGVKNSDCIQDRGLMGTFETAAHGIMVKIDGVVLWFSDETFEIQI